MEWPTNGSGCPVERFFKKVSSKIEEENGYATSPLDPNFKMANSTMYFISMFKNQQPTTAMSLLLLIYHVNISDKL